MVVDLVLCKIGGCWEERLESHEVSFGYIYLIDPGSQDQTRNGLKCFGPFVIDFKPFVIDLELFVIDLKVRDG